MSFTTYRNEGVALAGVCYKTTTKLNHLLLSHCDVPSHCYLYNILSIS